MSWTERAGISFRIALRPPMRLAEPGSAWIVVTPPAMASGICGSTPGDSDAGDSSRDTGIQGHPRAWYPEPQQRGGAPPAELEWGFQLSPSGFHRTRSLRLRRSQGTPLPRRTDVACLISYFTSSKINGAPVGAMRTTCRGACSVTCMTIGSCMPDSSNRYAGNVPAGTATFSIAPTFTLTDLVTPSPDENTLRLNILPVSSGSAG